MKSHFSFFGLPREDLFPSPLRSVINTLLPAGESMRKWGIVISVFYALILMGVIVPAAVFLFGNQYSRWSEFFSDLRTSYRQWLFWIPAGAILASQALLLFLSVDTSQKRLKPRAHILVSVTVGALLTALLSSAVIWSLGYAIRGDKFWENFSDKQTNILAFLECCLAALGHPLLSLFPQLL